MQCDHFEDLIFVDDKLIAKTEKIMSLKNLYAYVTECVILQISVTSDLRVGDCMGRQVCYVF